tara:strand:+ start:134 stop:901 length:768 start_codon:yes stop_codon:yes gene_type:complete
MANYLFKKSFLLNSLIEIPYSDLWNSKGVFSTIRVVGSPPNLIFLNEHIKNINKSLIKLKINFRINLKQINLFLQNEIKNNLKYDHLLRIAINNKKISISLRKRLNSNEIFKGILINYQRPKFEIKNLYYKKILKLLNSINKNASEYILYNKDSILEGCTTNIIFVKNKKLYIPKNNYYFGTTLQFILNHTKRKILKKKIPIDKINNFEEILLVGSGKGVISLNNIPQIKWTNKSQIIYKELQQMYNSFIERSVH